MDNPSASKEPLPKKRINLNALKRGSILIVVCILAFSFLFNIHSLCCEGIRYRGATPTRYQKPNPIPTREITNSAVEMQNH